MRYKASNLWLCAVLLLCLALRLGLAFMFSDADVEQDARMFMQIGQNIADGNGFTYIGEDSSGRWQPSAYGYVFYPYFLAFLMYTIDADLLAILVAHAFIDTLACYLIFVLTLRVTASRTAAVGAALFFAIYPPFLHSSCHPFPETTSLAILAGAILLLLRAFRGGKWGFALAGAVMGIEILSRPSMLLFPLFLGLVMCLKRRDIGGWLRNAAIYIIAAYLVVSPWTIRNYKVFHTFVPVTTNMGMVLWQATGPYDGKCLAPFYPMAVAGKGDPGHPLIAVVSQSTFDKISKLKERTHPTDELRRGRTLQRAAIQEIKENPGRVAIAALKKPFRLWFGLFGDFPISALSCFMAAVNILLMACAILAFRKPGIDSRFKMIVAAVLIYITLVSLGSSGTMRYSYPFMPYVLIMVSALLFGSRYKSETSDGEAVPEAVD